MKVMLVNGSSRPNGCTSVALAEVARALEAEGIQTETLWIGNKPMSDCIACGKCRQTGKCVFDNAAAIFGVRAADLSLAAPSIMRIPAPGCWPLWTGLFIPAGATSNLNRRRPC